MCIPKWSLLLLLLCASVALSACTILPQKEPVDVFVLRSESGGIQAPDTSAILNIYQPRSSGMLSSANVVVMPHSHQLSVYKGVRWNAPVPQMLQEYLIRNFRTVPVFAAVVESDTSVKADYLLVTDLLAFQSSYIAADPSGNPVIEVEVDAQLIDAQHRTIVAQRRFSLTEPSSATEVDAVVEAFNRAAASLSNAMLEWTAQSIVQQEQK